MVQQDYLISHGLIIIEMYHFSTVYQYCGLKCWIGDTFSSLIHTYYAINIHSDTIMTLTLHAICHQKISMVDKHSISSLSDIRILISVIYKTGALFSKVFPGRNPLDESKRFLWISV